MGDMAYDADNAEECREALWELQELLFKHREKKKFVFTKKDYPNEPNYVLYQNNLMEEGMSSTQRKNMAKKRYAAAKQAKKGDTIVCAGCGCSLVKTHYAQAFCKEKIQGRSTCKDFYYNWDQNYLSITK